MSDKVERSVASVASDVPGRRLLRGLHVPRGQAWCYGDAQKGAAVSNVLRSLHSPCWADVTRMRQEPCRSRVMSSEGEAT
jgi:hypothetical protein